MSNLISATISAGTSDIAPANPTSPDAASLALLGSESGGAPKSFEETLVSMLSSAAITAPTSPATTVPLNETAAPTEGQSLPLWGNSLPIAAPELDNDETILPEAPLQLSSAPPVNPHANIAAAALSVPAFRSLDTLTAPATNKPLLGSGQTLSPAGLSTELLPDSQAAAIDLLSSVQSFPVATKAPLTVVANEIFELPVSAENKSALALSNEIVFSTSATPPTSLQSVATSATPLTVQTPVQQPGFGEDLGQRVMWMVKNDMQAADIKINPPHLGPIEVRVTINNDQTSITFNTPHALVKEALDLAMPRLRELFGDANSLVTNVNVSQQSLGDQRGQHTGNHANASAYSRPTSVDGESANAEAVDPRGQWVKLGLVDYFA